MERDTPSCYITLLEDPGAMLALNVYISHSYKMLITDLSEDFKATSAFNCVWEDLCTH